jgi:hypothetical protein
MTQEVTHGFGDFSCLFSLRLVSKDEGTQPSVMKRHFHIVDNTVGGKGVPRLVV